MPFQNDDVISMKEEERKMKKKDFLGVVDKRKRKRSEGEDDFEKEMEGERNLSISRRRRRRKLAFPDRRKGRKNRFSEKDSKKEREEGEEEEESSSMSESSFESKEEKEEERIEEGDFEREESDKEEEEEEESEVLGEDFFEEDEDEEWVPSTTSGARKLERPFKRNCEEERGKEELEQSDTEEEEGKREEDESESDSERSDGEVLLLSSGAKLLTPPKVLSKKGVTEDQLQRKKPMMKSSSLEEVVADVGKGRMKKKKEKKRFEEARWERVENIQKRRWTFSKVPDEKKKLLIDLPARNNIMRLAVFSLYFTDDLLLYLLERRESEMATYWSSGLSIRVNLQTIKQVCFLKAFLFTFDSYLLYTDVSFDHLHHWNQEVPTP